MEQNVSSPLLPPLCPPPPLPSPSAPSLPPPPPPHLPPSQPLPPPPPMDYLPPLCPSWRAFPLRPLVAAFPPRPRRPTFPLGPQRPPPSGRGEERGDLGSEHRGGMMYMSLMGARPIYPDPGGRRILPRGGGDPEEMRFRRGGVRPRRGGGI
ncbi:hypothetical protein H6P81_006798 [Aristolochia fimbriata]|uniref:Uncharacterized protein n=1 Tax=Aristolochia fimbriata TaxID=158543 RepID=A0AAV7EZP1_ARIFI|nr:hypothetical protein H6P81_006798 [Aristolochia fimbriata]